MVSLSCDKVQLENRKRRESCCVVLWRASVRDISATRVLWRCWTTDMRNKLWDRSSLLPWLPPTARGSSRQHSWITQEAAPELGFNSPKFWKKTPQPVTDWSNLAMLRCTRTRLHTIYSIYTHTPLGKARGRNSFLSHTLIWCFTFSWILLEQKSQHWAVSNNWVLPQPALVLLWAITTPLWAPGYSVKGKPKTLRGTLHTWTEIWEAVRSMSYDGK